MISLDPFMRAHRYWLPLLIASVLFIGNETLAQGVSGTTTTSTQEKEQLITNIKQAVHEIGVLQSQKGLIMNSSVLLEPKRIVLGSKVDLFIKKYGKDELRKNLQVDLDGEYEIARVFHRGLGIHPDYREAFFWFGKAAEDGHLQAPLMLSGFYLIGRGCDRNVQAALAGMVSSMVHHPIAFLAFAMKLSNGVQIYGFGTPFWLIVYVVIFWLTWIWKKRPGRFFDFLFPRTIYWTKEFWLEVQLQVLVILGVAGFLVDTLFTLLLLNWTLEGIQTRVSFQIDLPSVVSDVPGLGVVVYFLIIFLTTELFAYIAHYLNHKVRFLWEFHRVHHAPSTITPFTLYRVHPVDYLVQKTFLFIGSILSGLIVTQGLTGNWLFLQLSFVSYSLTILNNLFSHSHLPFSFGGFLNSIFVTPIMHHIHHSKASQHSDKNFGLVLTIYDQIFGTICKPEPDECIEFGVSDETKNEYNNLYTFYCLPFKRALGTLREVASTNVP